MSRINALLYLSVIPFENLLGIHGMHNRSEHGRRHGRLSMDMGQGNDAVRNDWYGGKTEGDHWDGSPLVFLAS